MDKLIIANAVVSGLFFIIWRRDNLINFLIKASLLGLLIWDVLRLAGKV